MVRVAAAQPDAAGSRFELSLVDGGGVGWRTALSASVRVEDGMPVRSFRWSRKLEHFPGWWWVASTGRHVGYESWLERDHLVLLDFDPEVTSVVSQPFWLHWHDGRRMRRHAPDFFARRTDGTGLVVDVRADERIKPTDAEAFEVTAQACAEVGWAYRRVGALGAVLVANVRWLAGYRHPRCAGAGEVAGRLREAFATRAPLWVGAAEVGDRLAVLPALFHLLWRQELVADLTTARLGPSTLVQHRQAPTRARGVAPGERAAAGAGGGGAACHR